VSAPFGGRTRGMAGGEPWSALPATDWSTIRVDLPDDFDRDIIAAAEEGHPLRTYGRDVVLGLLAAGFAVFAFACIRAAARLWL
jgi:hypothetical protein